MLKNKKLMLAVALPILILGVGYKMTRPAPVNKDKIKGTIYVMPAPFLLNLQDGRFAKLTVALELAPGQSDGASATAAAASGENAVGTLPEEPIVREIVTDAVTNQNGETLVSESGRRAVKHQILKAIQKQTDVKVESVLMPDLTVQ
ncbi:MAG TPA: flagellar basal body-associated FliL family protein [Solirubrobacteraceae bacterium]|jgi:flagellar basal body-associated protein FliL|nr:flagellar basal body-associated FliL family protein [Solirubrobacteraceae bacterium]